MNGNLLVSGKQIYSIHIFPYQDENFINKKAIVKAKIFVRDGFDFSKPKILVSEIIIPDFSKDEEPRKEFKILSDFEAFIPYNHLGWNSSINLLNENKKLLMEEIEEFYNELYAIFKSFNIEKYKNLTNIRFNELCSSFYLTEQEMKRREVSFIPKFKGNILKESILNYEMVFAGGGNLVAIRIPNEPIGLKFISDNETDNIIYEQAFFHRKK